MQGLHTGFLQPVLHVLRHRVGEAFLVLHQRGPVDPRVTGHSLAAQQPRGVDRLGPGAQHFLWITAPQGTGAAVGEFVHNGDGPACTRGLFRSVDPGHAGADDDQVKCFGHEISLKSRVRNASVAGSTISPEHSFTMPPDSNHAETDREPKPAPTVAAQRQHASPIRQHR